MTTQPSHDPRADAELLAAYVAGDLDALAVLVHCYQRVLLSLVRHLSGYEPDPEAVVQEVWLRVLKGAGTYSGQAKVSTWLHRITVNEAISAARRRRANHSSPVGELYRTHDQPERSDPDDPSLTVVDREQARAVLPELLALLPREQRLVLEVLHPGGPRPRLLSCSGCPSAPSSPAPLAPRPPSAHTSPRAKPGRPTSRSGLTQRTEQCDCWATSRRRPPHAA